MKRFLFAIISIFIVVGCSGQAVEPTPVVRDVQVTLVNSEITPGFSRIAIALFDSNNQFIHDAEVEFEYFDLTDIDNPVSESSATAVTRQTADGFTTIYTHFRTLERAGSWGLQVNASFPDGSIAQQGIAFQVVTEAVSFPVGLKAPPVDTLTRAVVDDISLITTAFEPVPAFYDLSIRDALENEKPTIIYFSTPAFCQTRLCAPGYEELADFHEDAANEYNFVHIEVFEGLPNPAESGWPLAPAMVAFGLTTEPWLYVVDASGTVVMRLEGLFTAAELQETLPEVLQ
ncbi:MAG: hypothetical protein AAF490_21665 [Chloroflexota bacterium]